ncbi:unnamed protein product [Phytophthora fragariaefolia]|uniref:Unnamed protein product n=1 Tax=Phytophthora fragariaefolia TaxID=1490495 RepID=A0A9W6Y436_9STRA|nr:unnamed protein product [Phytophthora fragariaefolia]
MHSCRTTFTSSGLSTSGSSASASGSGTTATRRCASKSGSSTSKSCRCATTPTSACCASSSSCCVSTPGSSASTSGSSVFAPGSSASTSGCYAAHAMPDCSASSSSASRFGRSASTSTPGCRASTSTSMVEQYDMNASQLSTYSNNSHFNSLETYRLAEQRLRKRRTTRTSHHQRVGDCAMFCFRGLPLRIIAKAFHDKIYDEEDVNLDAGDAARATSMETSDELVYPIEVIDLTNLSVSGAASEESTSSSFEILESNRFTLRTMRYTQAPHSVIDLLSSDADAEEQSFVVSSQYEEKMFAKDDNMESSTNGDNKINSGDFECAVCDCSEDDCGCDDCNIESAANKAVEWLESVVQIRHVKNPDQLQIEYVGAVDWRPCTGSCQPVTCTNAL